MSGLTRAAVLVFFALGSGCKSPIAKKADVEATPVVEESNGRIGTPVVVRHEPSWQDIASDDCALGSDLKGQLDRIDSILGSTLFLTGTSTAVALFKDSEDKVPHIRQLVADGGRSADPRVYLEIAAFADQRARVDGTVLYKMLVKNPQRYAGRPWFVMGAKILDLAEKENGSIGRIEMDPGSSPLFVGARFLTPFVEGDRVDVVGYFAGTESYEANSGSQITIPAMAVAGIFKSGTIAALNKIEKMWNGNVGPDQLRSLPRKF